MAVSITLDHQEPHSVYGRDQRELPNGSATTSRPQAPFGDRSMRILLSGYHNPHYLTVTEYIERAIAALS